MKVGGVSWNTGMHRKKGVVGEHSCSECGRKYKMVWARDNHQRLCKQRFASPKNNRGDND